MVQPFHQTGFYKQEQADGTLLVRAAVEKACAVRGIEHVECKNEFCGRKKLVCRSFEISE
jgi:hypothetical protein